LEEAGVPKSSVERAWSLLVRLDSYFTLASVKAALILPANAVLLAVTSAGLYQVLSSSSTSAVVTLPVKVALTAMLASALISTVFALFVVVAFLKSGNRSGDYVSLVFFGSVRSMERQTYCKKFSACDQSDLTDDILQQVHLLSDALHNKYVFLNWSVLFCALGYLLLGIAAVLMLWRM
jgi:Family of unknown function (DUF5706)